MNMNEYEHNRDTWRKKYEISDDTIVFVYSGGLSKWQQIDELILEKMLVLNKLINANIFKY